jgi:predicted enzyme related to lactoylglutathione lyase
MEKTAEDGMENQVVWFDLPAQDLDRAMKFYSGLLGRELQFMEHGDNQCAFFPFQPGVASGSLVKSPNHTPSQQGTVIYFNGGNDLAEPLGKVESLGGKVIQEKMSIGDHGFIAYFIDTEGNKVALHSPQ